MKNIAKLNIIEKGSIGKRSLRNTDLDNLKYSLITITWRIFNKVKHSFIPYLLLASKTFWMTICHSVSCRSNIYNTLGHSLLARACRTKLYEMRFLA